MRFCIEKEASAGTVRQIISITESYTEDFFTDNVPADTTNDLLFQSVAYLMNESEIVSFLVFTCLDGSPHITLFAT